MALNIKKAAFFACTKLQIYFALVQFVIIVWNQNLSRLDHWSSDFNSLYLWHHLMTTTQSNILKFNNREFSYIMQSLAIWRFVRTEDSPSKFCTHLLYIVN